MGFGVAGEGEGVDAEGAGLGERAGAGFEGGAGGADVVDQKDPAAPHGVGAGDGEGVFHVGFPFLPTEPGLGAGPTAARESARLQWKPGLGGKKARQKFRLIKTPRVAFQKVERNGKHQVDFFQFRTGPEGLRETRPEGAGQNVAASVF
jgi:hypothetical protein